MLHDAALGPATRPLKGFLLVATGVLQGGQLVEGEHDVGADLVLYLHGDLGRETVPVPVQVRLEPDAVLVHMRQPLLARGHGVVRPGRVHGGHVDDLLEPRAEAHHLEPTRVRERGPVPVHERAEPARRVQDLRPRLQVQVVGVGQQGLRAELLHGFGQHGFDRGFGPDGDERGRLDLAVRCGDGAGAAQELPALAAAWPCRRRRSRPDDGGHVSLSRAPTSRKRGCGAAPGGRIGLGAGPGTGREVSAGTVTVCQPRSANRQCECTSVG